jgi:hypothetical protein
MQFNNKKTKTPIKNQQGHTDEWIKKMWYLCTMGFYTAMKKSEILPFAGEWKWRT